MHSHQKFREHHASRRRVAHLLKSESGRAPAKAGGGAVGNRMKGALSAPDSADVMTEGSARPKRMAKPKAPRTVNIAIVHHPRAHPMMGPPTGGAPMGAPMSELEPP